MSPDTETLREDLAFLRGLVSASDDYARSFGQGYFLAGVIYGTQLLLHAAQGLGWIPSVGLWSLAIGLGPTLVFVPLVIWIATRSGPPRGGSTSRAVGAVFAAAGSSNFALIAVIGLVAWREQNFTTWLIYPACVFVFQGAAWLVVWTLRRRAWMGLVSLGWFAAAVTMAAVIGQIEAYLAVAAAAIWLCMALPGWLMMRRSPALPA